MIDANQLVLVKSVQPEYPWKAREGSIEGWVELDFTVVESGQVKDLSVHAANPRGVFDQAAIGALSQWRYKPVLVEAKPIAQRAHPRPICARTLRNHGTPGIGPGAAAS